MTAARPGDELREALEKLIHDGIVSQWQGSMREDVALTDPRPIVRDLLPVVTAWAERQARERAAEIVARVKAVPTYRVITDGESLGYVVIAGDVLDALTADGGE